jgi:hypothetical protein
METSLAEDTEWAGHPHDPNGLGSSLLGGEAWCFGFRGDGKRARFSTTRTGLNTRCNRQSHDEYLPRAAHQECLLGEGILFAACPLTRGPELEPSVCGVLVCRSTLLNWHCGRVGYSACTFVIY